MSAGNNESPQLRSKYEQLYEELRSQLIGGDHSHDQPMATEHQLAREYGVSRVTVRKALKLLEDEGLIVRKRRLGTFPARRVVPFEGASSVAKLAEETAWLAEHSEVRLLSLERVSAPQWLQKILGLEPGVRVTRFARIRSDDSGPIAHLTTFLWGDFAEGITESAVLKSPPLVLLAQQGIEFDRTEQSISAELATEQTADWLKVKRGDPLIRTTRTIISAEGEPLIYTIARLRADRYELRYTLDERHAKGTPEVWRLVEA